MSLVQVKKPGFIYARSDNIQPGKNGYHYAASMKHNPLKMGHLLPKNNKSPQNIDGIEERTPMLYAFPNDPLTYSYVTGQNSNFYRPYYQTINNPLKQVTFKQQQQQQQQPRFIIPALIAGLFGFFKPPPTQNTSITFQTQISDQQSFKNSISQFNKAISDFILNQAQVVVSNVSNLSTFNLYGLSSDELNLSINNNQTLKFYNFSQIDVTSVNKFVSTQCSKLVEDIMNNFQATSTSSLDVLSNQQQNTSLISALLSAPVDRSGNINTVLNSSTSVNTAYSYEKQLILNTLNANSNIQNFAQNLTTNLSNVFKVDIGNISVNGKANIVFANNQSIDSTINMITKLNVINSTYAAVNVSDTFKVDNSVITSVSQLAQAASQQLNQQEGLGNVIDAGGNAVSKVVASWGLVVVGGVALVAAGYALLSRPQNNTAATTTEVEEIEVDDDDDDGNNNNNLVAASSRQRP